MCERVVFGQLGLYEFFVVRVHCRVPAFLSCLGTFNKHKGVKAG